MFRLTTASKKAALAYVAHITGIADTVVVRSEPGIIVLRFKNQSDMVYAKQFMQAARLMHPTCTETGTWYIATVWRLTVFRQISVYSTRDGTCVIELRDTQMEPMPETGAQ